MHLHPYIGLQATVAAYLQPGRTGHKPQYTGTIVHIGTDSEECDGYAVHYPCAVLLMADGSHETAPMNCVTVDHAVAAARLGESGRRDVRATFKRNHQDPALHRPDIVAHHGKVVRILSIDGHRANCVPADGGPIFNVDLMHLEIASDTDLADVRALYQRLGGGPAAAR